VIELLTANAIYVAYRLVVSGPLVKLLLRWLPYYAAVFVMAQFSFLYDNVIFAWLFGAQELPGLAELIYADIKYTLRVVAAWWVIKQLWNWIGNYWIAVFLGAQLTFAVDYFIFADLFN
jgi:hypothetical protein